MSIGCYFYGLMLVNIRKHPQKFKRFVARAKVQIVESPVIGTLNEMAAAIAILKFPKNRFKRRVLSGAALSYFAVTSPFTVSVYNATIEYFRSKSLPVPSLIYTTEGDPMARADAFESLVEDWRKNHENVRSKVWVNSEHAGENSSGRVRQRDEQFCSGCVERGTRTETGLKALKQVLFFLSFVTNDKTFSI